MGPAASFHTLFASRTCQAVRCQARSLSLRLAFSLLVTLPAMAHSQDTASADRAINLPQVCGSKLQSPAISWQLPKDVEGRLLQANMNVAQRASDLFSWQLLIALHWPARDGERGMPDTDRKLGAAGAKVWETWREAAEVYRQDTKGQPLPPLAWNAPSAPMPQSCQGASRVLYRIAKVNDTLDNAVQPTGSRGGPITLTDRKGNLTYYEIRLNQVAYDTINQHKWWDARVQNGLDQFRFPSGAIIAKAAWIPIEDKDKSRFESMDACVCDKFTDNSETACKKRPVGLVGFHLMSKTDSAPQWIWSTYEQQDNVGITNATYWNPGSHATPNQQTAPGVPNQITRVIPIPSRDPDCRKPEAAVDNIQALNRDMQKALGNTPLAHYLLVNTQWPLPGLFKQEPTTVFKVRPRLLGNTTLESFIQNSSSCMGCHAMARSQRPAQFVSADFTFTLNDAAPVLANRRILTAPEKSQVSPQVWHGYVLVDHTYESLRNNVKAQLHCSSCHLDAGRNADAAWFRGAIAYQNQHFKNGGIAGRINQCFTNSMNGTPLCTADGANGKAGANSCSNNLNMQSIIAYMKWIDEQPVSIPLPKSPYPPIAAKVGDPSNGKEIFLQKCAFCHGTDGQGRYQGDIYYRPALWGPHSFNTNAGMSTSTDLAQFLHGNMPYRSGGLLTAQESWDLACFIDSQARPKGTASVSTVRTETAAGSCQSH